MNRIEQTKLLNRLTEADLDTLLSVTPDAASSIPAKAAVQEKIAALIRWSEGATSTLPDGFDGVFQKACDVLPNFSPARR